jgi:hypothetical protein
MNPSAYVELDETPVSDPNSSIQGFGNPYSAPVPDINTSIDKIVSEANLKSEPARIKQEKADAIFIAKLLYIFKTELLPKTTKIDKIPPQQTKKRWYGTQYIKTTYDATPRVLTALKNMETDKLKFKFAEYLLKPGPYGYKYIRPHICSDGIVYVIQKYSTL